MNQPIVFACVRRDALLERLAWLDPETRRLVELSLPRDLPRQAAIAGRDGHIRAAAELLRAAQPGISDHAVALALQRAGDRIAAGLRSGLAADAEHCLRDAFRWAPERADGTRWPRWRQILRLCHRAPVAMTNAPDAKFAHREEMVDESYAEARR
jgi:hypothetical protein